jgi:Tfp pilus assembly protein PilN
MIAPQFRRWLAVGSGIGIEIQGDDLVVMAVRVRFARVHIMGEHRIHSFLLRPAAEWSAEYDRFVSSVGLRHFAAQVVLPRESLIVRLVSFPAISKKELSAAIGFQLDSLHPYEDQEVAHAWAELERKGEVLVALARREVIRRYETLFAEAGIQLASISVAAATFYSSIRMFKAAANTDFAAFESNEGGVEIYGESSAKPMFSALIAGPAQRAFSIARAELRLSPEQQPVPLSEILPVAENRSVMSAAADSRNPEFHDQGTEAHLQEHGGAVAVARAIEAGAQTESSSSSRAYAAALNAACPWLSLQVNLLPKEARKSNSRLLYLPTALFAVLLIICAVTLTAENAWEQRRYLKRLHAEISRLEPIASHAQQLQRRSDELKKKSLEVDSFRSRTHVDLDAINELTRILPPPIWVSALDMNRTGVSLAGDAPDAAGLLKTIDASPFFQGSAFQQSIVRSNEKRDVFRVKTQREQVVP